MLIENYQYFLAFLGLAFLGLAILPKYLDRSFVSLPMVYILLGFLITLIWTDLPQFDPLEHNILVEKITEFTVIVSLMGVGLKIVEPLKFSTWKSTLRLLLITMPIFIALISVMSNIWMGLSYGAAILLGAVLSPTDPVLAGDVQVSSPHSGEFDSKVKFILTSEAGLNDGLAFPFVYLGGLLVLEGFNADMILGWLSYEFAYKIICGVVMGYLCGKAIGYIIFHNKRNFQYHDGFVAIAITLVTYGLTEMVHGYGFIAVFFAAYFFRQTSIEDKYHARLNTFSEEIESLLTSLLLIVFGIALGHGILDYLTIESILIGLAIIFVIRPLIGYLSLYKTGLKPREKWIVSFLGIKGIGSFYYLAFGLHNFTFDTIDVRMIWSLVSFVILVSVIVHGISAPIMIKRHEKLIRERK